MNKIYRQDNRKKILPIVAIIISFFIIQSARNLLEPFLYFFGTGSAILGFFLMLFDAAYCLILNESSISAQYLFKGKVLLHLKNIKWEEIETISVNDVGWFVILPKQESRKYKFKNIIYIKRTMPKCKEIMRFIFSHVPRERLEEKVISMVSTLEN